MLEENAGDNNCINGQWKVFNVAFKKKIVHGVKWRLLWVEANMNGDAGWRTRGDMGV